MNSEELRGNYGLDIHLEVYMLREETRQILERVR